MTDRTSRRAFVAAGAGLSGFVAKDARAALAPTPLQAAGPFYPRPEQRRADQDWDLVKVEGEVREAGGEIMRLEGRVLDRDGAPIAGARVEIWQCDVHGRYHHPLDRNPDGRDQGFQGFGHAIADAEGRYRFRTIRPTPYPGRTPHIHAKIFTPAGVERTTQIYVEGDPGNDGDGLFRRLSAEQREAALFTPRRAGDGVLDASFDFVV